MKRFFSVLACAALLLPLQTHAEIYQFKDGSQQSPESAYVIKDMAQSQRFFGHLREKGEEDYFTFTVQKDSRIDIRLESPVADGDFRPYLILFGPGLPAPKEDPVIQIGESNGAIVGHAPEERERRFDLFLLTSFHVGPTITIDAPKDATYAIAVRTAKGSTGRYILHTGTKDPFRWRDIPQGIIGVFKGILRLY